MAAFNKPASLPLPDLNRPAFCAPKLRELVSARKCPMCQKDICDDDFKTDLDRKEYSISGMCAACQADIFSFGQRLCAVGECKPRKEMSKANEACVECTKSIMENSVELGAEDTKHAESKMGKIENPKTAERCCSIHGRENITTEDMDKGYWVECEICKAGKHVRVWEMWECM